MTRMFALLVLMTAVFVRPGHATNACTYNFASGPAASGTQACATENGNIAQFSTFGGFEHIALGTGGEGYGLCDYSSTTGYWDFAVDYSNTPLALTADSGNWGATQVLSSNQNSVRIRRSTLDGIWTLTQTLSLSPLTLALRVDMTLRNNSNMNRVVNLIRFADINASGMSDNIFDATLYSAMAWNSYGSIVNGSSTQPYGVLLQNGGASPNLFSVIAAVRNVNYPPHPCVPINNQGTQPPVDGSLFMSYGGTIARHSSASVSMSYRGL